MGVRGPQRRLSGLRGPVCPETWASPHHLPGGPRTELWLTSGSCPSWHISRWGPITVGGPSALRPAGLGLACDRTLEGQAWGGGREVMLGREGAGALTGVGGGGRSSQVCLRGWGQLPSSLTVRLGQKSLRVCPAWPCGGWGAPLCAWGDSRAGPGSPCLWRSCPSRDGDWPGDSS